MVHSLVQEEVILTAPPPNCIKSAPILKSPILTYPVDVMLWFSKVAHAEIFHDEKKKTKVVVYS